MSITSCRKFLSLNPVFVCVDECEVTSDPDMSECADDDNEKSDRQPADTNNVDRRGESPPPLSPLPVSCFRSGGKKNSTTVSCCSASSNKELYPALRGSLNTLRLSDVSIAYGDESLTPIEKNMIK